MTNHVDDLNVAGEPQWINAIMAGKESTFGKLKVLWNEFTNCGVHHLQHKITKECTLDQIEYAKNLRTISHDEIRTKPAEAECGVELHQLYMSLLGAVALSLSDSC